MARGTRLYRATRRITNVVGAVYLDTSAHSRLDLAVWVARQDRRVFVIWHADASPFRDAKHGRCNAVIQIRKEARP